MEDTPANNKVPETSAFADEESDTQVPLELPVWLSSSTSPDVPRIIRQARRAVPVAAFDSAL